MHIFYSVHLTCRYFVIDPSDHKDLKIEEISLGFYLEGKQSAVAAEETVKQGFIHTLGELKVHT